MSTICKAAIDLSARNSKWHSTKIGQLTGYPSLRVKLHIQEVRTRGLFRIVVCLDAVSTRCIKAEAKLPGVREDTYLFAFPAPPSTA